MVERKISVKRHVFAASLAIVIFLIGLSIGSLLNKSRVSYLDTSAKEETLDLESLQVQYLYLTSVLEDKKNCVGARRTLDEGVYNLGMLSSKLDAYIQDQSLYAEKDFTFLKRDYTLAQLRYWLFLQKMKIICDYNTVTVLYFYSTEGCDDCRTQGIILTHLKSKLGDKLLNFAFDSVFLNEPMIGIIKESYNITESPTLVIEGEKYEGLQTEEKLTEVICAYLKEDEFCKS